MDAADDLTGTTVGEYQILAKLGVGGMGVVYEGVQPLIGKRVAVKVLLPQFTAVDELVQRFLAEARAVNAIRHRGIVDIFSFGQLPDGRHYFVMEFLDGQPFDKYLKERAPLPLDEALRWTEEMLDALGSAHHANVVHRDVKPSNLYLVKPPKSRPYLKLLDFGIAEIDLGTRDATPTKRASNILGTPDYLAPEQVLGTQVVPQTDLYSVGCVLFEMVTGRRPFKSETQLRTLWKHVEDPRPLASALRPELPKELDEIIVWAMQIAPGQRPESADALAERIAALRESVPRAAPRPSAEPKPGRPSAPAPPAPRAADVLPSPAATPPAHIVEPDAAQPPPPAVLAPTHAPAGRRRSVKAIALGGLLGVLALVGLVVAFQAPARSAPPSSAETPKPSAAPTPAAELVAPPPAPAEGAPAEPVAAAAPMPEAAPEPAQADVKPEAAAKADDRKPKLTTATLRARLNKLNAKLAAKESAAGDQDPVLRRFLEAAGAALQGASSERELRSVAKQLDDIAAQLR